MTAAPPARKEVSSERTSCAPGVPQQRRALERPPSATRLSPGLAAKGAPEDTRSLGGQSPREQRVAGLPQPLLLSLPLPPAEEGWTLCSRLLATQILLASLPLPSVHVTQKASIRVPRWKTLARLTTVRSVASKTSFLQKAYQSFLVWFYQLLW